MKKINSLAVIVIVLLLSCKKEPGEGGFASIEGKVFLKNYDAFFSILSSQYYQPGETVYIIYGDQTEVGNTVKTSYDGSFKFNYLRKGKYKVYVIGEDSSITNRSNPKIEMVEVTISGKKDKKNIGDLVILK
jgi:hypothetical protein